MLSNLFDDIHHAFSFPNNRIDEDRKLSAADDGLKDEKMSRGLGENQEGGKDG
jgi:hypothetical protein